ncbi:cleft lip and palate associated transmembrane protein [Sistotremastrum suecicum HHB10207 ss-3]|uniref:Cleft lip and palate associated transmembrane protein n=1 Tax=Sistotremastrum suecicum HHB10207 ss-3 TaxID=1314776 RepID=A0A166DCF5_9AGAM|nr:cleft lip and palate associated transmembrane protein [Sistotremastrum suecicum HHB10207 ss-3]
MPTAATAQPAAGNGQQRQQEGPSFWQTAQKALMMYMLVQLAMKYFMPSQSPATTPVVPDASPASPVLEPGQVDPRTLPPVTIHPLWDQQTPVSLRMDLSTADAMTFYSPGYKRTENLPSISWDNITWGSWDYAYTANFDVKIPKSVQRNGTLFAHIALVKAGVSLNPTDPSFDPQGFTVFSKLLSRYVPKAKIRKERNLLSSDEEFEEETEVQKDVIASHWHPNLTIALVSDSGPMPVANLAPPIRQFVNIHPIQRDETGTKGFYYPIIFTNDFWHLRSQLIEINDTTPILPLEVSVFPTSFMKFQIYATLGHGFEEAAKQQGGSANAELDELKRMLTETNPYLLALTAIVSVLHMVFEMLAFKNDVQHWRTKKEMTGVSVRTIITNVVIQGIILLYLLDNNADTSWMIVFGQGTGMLIEAWKITKAVDISVIRTPAGSLLPYKISIKDKHVLSETEKKTQEYDALAFRYVSYVAIPLLAGYTVYSLIYSTHRGWYSFILSTLTSFVYMFGFAQLVPQLIINYKLKSVSHMPFKAMIYKTLSTVVDDFFAFCIKMPFLHRLACFRDDVVFMIFLYQRYIYRVDHSRINEFGQVSEKLLEEEATESKKNQ